MTYPSWEFRLTMLVKGAPGHQDSSHGDILFVLDSYLQRLTNASLYVEYGLVITSI